MEEEISSDKNQKEAFCETTQGHVNFTHPVKLLFSLSSILTLFEVSQLRDTQERFEVYSEKGNIVR